MLGPTVVKNPRSYLRREHGTCLKAGMLPTLPHQPTALISETHSSSNQSDAALEIRAYLGARNLLLRQAEENITEATLCRAADANDFAEKCLRPTGSPYEAQSLPEAEAARERQNCKAVRLRIAELRGRAGLQDVEGMEEVFLALT